MYKPVKPYIQQDYINHPISKFKKVLYIIIGIALTISLGVGIYIFLLLQYTYFSKFSPLSIYEESVLNNNLIWEDLQCLKKTCQFKPFNQTFFDSGNDPKLTCSCQNENILYSNPEYVENTLVTNGWKIKSHKNQKSIFTKDKFTVEYFFYNDENTSDRTIVLTVKNLFNMDIYYGDLLIN